jgi:hypothetical protein
MSGAGGMLVWVVWFIGAAVIALVTVVLLALVPRDPRPANADHYGATYEPMRPTGRLRASARKRVGRFDEPAATGAGIALGRGDRFARTRQADAALILKGRRIPSPFRPACGCRTVDNVRLAVIPLAIRVPRRSSGRS